MPTPPLHPLRPFASWAGLAAAARTWSVESQQVARRNAMVASTACAQRRVERQDVEDFLAARYAPAQPADDAASVRPAHG